MLTRLCSTLEQVIASDPGHRGIQHLFISGELYRCLYLLTRSQKHVIIGTGFPVTPFDPPTESDGPAGSMLLAYSLLKSNPQRKVTLIYDPIHEPLFGPLTNAFNDEFHKLQSNSDTKPKLTAFNTQGIQSSDAFFSLSQFQDVDHMIAVELAGPNTESKFKSARNEDITARCGITASLFDHAFKNNLCITTGIGDGGNEVGMGKVKSNVEEHIQNGRDIACNIETKFLIAAGVSNWGAEALCMGLHLEHVMRTLDLEHEMYPSDEFHEKMYMMAAQLGAADAGRKVFDGGVDGMEYSVHKEMYDKLVTVTKAQEDKMFPKL